MPIRKFRNSSPRRQSSCERALRSLFFFFFQIKKYPCLPGREVEKKSSFSNCSLRNLVIFPSLFLSRISRRWTYIHIHTQMHAATGCSDVDRRVTPNGFSCQGAHSSSRKSDARTQRRQAVYVYVRIIYITHTRRLEATTPLYWESVRRYNSVVMRRETRPGNRHALAASLRENRG